MQLEHVRDKLAANIRAERARVHLDQGRVAEGMQRLGFPWHRQTVSTTERGTRRVTAEEILGLAEVIGTHWSVLMMID